MATITVTTFWNMDSRKWTSDLLGTTEQDPLAGLVQGDIVKFAVRFVQGGVAVALTAPVFTASGIKALNDFTGGYLVQLSAPVLSDTTLYTFTVSPLNSAQLNTFLQTYRNTWCALELYDSANGILTTPLELQITPGYSLSGTPTDNAPGTLVVAAGKTVTFPLTLTFPSAAGTNGQQLTLSNSTTGLLEWAASGSGITIGATTANGTAGQVLYTDGSLVQAYAISGTGSVAMTGDPVFTNLITVPYMDCTTEIQFGASATGLSYIDDSSANIITVTVPAGAFGTDKVITLPNATGTVTLNETISGGTLAGSFTTLAGTSSATLGTNGGTGGSLVLRGSTSGSATINVSATGGLQLGTPTTLVLTSATGLPVSTGISGLGTGVATALALATNAVGGMPTKLYEDWNPEEVTLYNSGAPTIDTASSSSFVGVKYLDGASTYIQFPISAARWAGRTVKMKMLVLGNTTEASKNFRLRLALEWRTSALDGATTSAAGPGTGMDGGGEDNGGAYNYPNGSSVSLTADKLLEVTSVDSWTIPANATFIGLFFGMERANAGDTYGGTLWSLLFMLQEQ